MTKTLSEKRVNIKITASTTDFDRAIKKAQQQIEKLTKAIEDIDSSKFGDKLEKQLESVSDSAKDMQNKLEDMQDSLDDINKSKVDKLEKQLNNAAESTEDLNEALEDTIDSLDDMNKTKVDNLEKQFKDVADSSEDLNEKIEDVIDSLEDMNDVDADKLRQSFEDVIDASMDMENKFDDLLDNLSKLDSQDLNKLDNEFEQIIDGINDFDRALDDIDNNNGFNNLKDDIQDIDEYIDETTDSMKDYNKAVDDISFVKFDESADFLEDANKRLEELTDGMKDFNREVEGLDTNEFKEFGEIMEDIGDFKKNFNFDANIDTGSNKGGLFSDITDGLVSGTIAGKQMSSALQGVTDKLDNVVDSMKDMSGLTLEEQVKSYDELVNELIKVQNESDEAAKKLAEKEEAYNKLTKEVEEYQEAQRKAKEYEDALADEQNKLENSFRDTKKSIQEYESALSDANKEVEFYKNVLDELQKKGKAIDDAFDINDLTKIKNLYGDLTEEVESLNRGLDIIAHNNLSEIIENFDDLSDEIKDAAKALNNFFAGEKGDFYNFDEWVKEAVKQMNEFAKVIRSENLSTDALEEVKTRYLEIRDALSEYVKAFRNEGVIEGIIEDQQEALQNLADAQERLNDLQSEDNDAVKKYKEECDQLEKLEKQIIDITEKRSELKDLEQDAKFGEIIDSKSLNKAKEEIDELAEEMKKLQETLDKGNQIANDSGDAFNEQYKAYERLSKKVKEYLEDEKNSIVQREKVAKSFREVSDAMEKVYAGSSKHNNLDLINKTLEEAAKHFKELDVASTTNLQRDLDRLGEIVEDKTEKIKRFKEANKEFGSDASKAAYGIEKQAESLKDYANSTAFVVEATETLKKAWGDISVGDVDNLKIRPRIELLEDYSKKLRQTVTEIEDYYSKIQGPLTAEQQDKLNDWKIWEKNAEKLKEYNKALEDYFTTIMDSSGNIDTKFLDELGKFDISKFVKEFEKMGTTSVVLQKQFNAVKIELQEWLQTEKEARQEAVKSAEAALKQAEANKKNAESQEDLAEATKEVKKAQDDLNEARKKLENFTTDASNEVKRLNEMAEALRKIGMAAEDLGKEDIASFDRSLASLLDRLDTFDNDLPNTFADLKEDIKAVFADMDSFDFGGVFDGLKDIGAGLLGKLPTELKVAAAAAWALEEALRACANAGIEQLSKGIDNISNVLSGLVGIARDVGQEIGDAFSNITGFQLDFSSLMEVPIEFEAQMKRVGAIAGAVGEDFEKLEKQAREFGATTPYSASEVAKAMEYMGQAGWDTTQIMDGLAGVLSLATVADMDLGKASDFVTDALTALGMEASQANEMVDKLAVVSVKTNTSVAQLQSAFSNVSSVAGSFNVSLDDLTIALGLMADKGVKGAKAGTAMKNLLTNLNKLTDERAAAIEKYNLEAAREDIINGRLLEGLKKLKSALSNLDTPEKNELIQTLFGKEALNGVSALLGTTTEKMNELESALGDCGGAAKKMADDFELSLKGAMNNLAGAMEETLLQIKDKVGNNVAGVINELTTLVNVLNGIEKSSSGLTGIVGFFEQLEETTRGWGEAIENGLTKAIGAINDFVNGAAFDNLLQAGTNIIKGIADGIKNAADNGTLDSAISTAIGKIATWFSENLDTIVEAGKLIIEAISKGISENSDEIGEVIKTVMEMQTEIDKAIAKEKWKLIGQNLISFICEGIVSKVSVFVSAFTGFFEGAIGDIANAFNDLIVNKLSPMLLDPIAVLGEGIGNYLKEVILSAFERAFDIDLSYLKGFNIWDPSSWFGDKDKKKDTSNKKSDSSNKGKTDTSSGSSGWDSIKKELESWGKSISDWASKTGDEISKGWDSICDSISGGGEKAGKWFSDSWASVEEELNSWGEGISNWGTSVANWFSDAWTSVCDSFSNWGEKASTSASNAWDSTLEELSGWKTGITNWGTEMGEELSKAGDNIKTFFTETLPSYFDPEKLGSALGIFTGTIARELVDGWEAIDAWGNDLYEKGSEAAINYSNGIRDFFIELPSNISTWVSDAWTAVDTWGNNLYTKGSEAAIRYSDGIRDFFIELPGKISTWLSNAWSAIDTWGNNLYTKGSEAAIRYSDGIRDYFADLYNSISTWLTNAWSAVDTWGTNLYTKGSEAAIRYSDGIRDFFVQLPGKITTWLSNATQSFTKWCSDLYNKGKEAVTKFINGLADGFKQLPGKITSWLNSGKKAITTWGNDMKKSASSAGKNIVNGIFSGMNNFKSTITSWCNKFKNSFVSSFKKAFGIHSPSTVMRDEVGVNLALGIEEGLNSGASNISSSVNGIVNTINSGMSGINTYDGSSLFNMDATGAQATAAAMAALGKTLSQTGELIDQAGYGFISFAKTLSEISENVNVSVTAFNTLAKTLTFIEEAINASTMSFAAFSNSFTGISDSTAIIREQFMSIANIINNQVTNARNALTSQFLSMAAVARTQMVNISNIIRNQAVAWSNIISNQSKNARDNLTRQFMSMASVVRTQMAKCLSSVKSYMSQIASTANKKMSMSLNVNRTVSTSYAGMPSANALYAANAASTYSLGANNASTLSSRASSIASGANSSSPGTRGAEEGQIIHTHVYLEGKEIARAAAKYMDGEIKTLNKREDRKRGVK